jgi:DNA (cytosine-5)-methyltransferase 1
MVRIASLCTGVAGLDIGITTAYRDQPVETLWYAELDPHASTVLAERLPGITNIGDLTVADWANLPAVDVITAGFPCQPVSAAGKQAAEKDSRWLWPHVLAAVRALRPQEVVLENVRNLVSIQQGRVFAGILTDLQTAGYAVRWAIAGACAIGSCHHRHRVFVIARHTGGRPTPPAERVDVLTCGAPRNRARLLMLPTPTAVRYGYNQGGASVDGPVRYSLDQAHHLFPTPTSSDGKGGPGCPGRDDPDTVGGYAPGSRYAQRHPGMADTTGTLLPTPRASDTGTPGRRGGDGFRPPLSQVIAEQQLLPTPCRRDYKVGFATARDRVNGATLSDIAQQQLAAGAAPLLPTPRHSDADKGGPNQHGTKGDLMLPSAVIGERYGRYAPAVALWQHMLGLPAPAPTMLNARGQWRLDPRLPEWMLGYPPGWITDLVDRLPALRLAGNGVVPQLVAALYPIMVTGWIYPQGGVACPDRDDLPGPGTAFPARPVRDPRTGPAAGRYPAGAVTAYPAGEQLALL